MELRLTAARHQKLVIARLDRAIHAFGLRPVLSRFGLGQSRFQNRALAVDLRLRRSAFGHLGLGGQIGQLRFGFGGQTFVICQGFLRQPHLARFVALQGGVGFLR